MNKQEQDFLGKVSDNFFKFMNNHLPNAATNAAVAATPLIGMAAYSAITMMVGVISRDPAALESAQFAVNHPNTMLWLSGLKGDLPMAAANHTYQYAAGALASAVTAGALSKVIEKFGSLREEAEHLRKENQMLKSEFTNERASDSGDTLRNRLQAGLGNMQSKMEGRDQPAAHSHEQATRNKGPKLG